MLKKIIRKITKKKIGFYYKYLNYKDALLNSDGYDNPNLLNHLYKQSILAIKKNKYIQDGIIYEDPQINKFFINYLCNNYILKKNFKFLKKIKILDYGGSFANQYFAIKNFLNLRFDWNIIEQKKIVKLASKSQLFKKIKFNYQIGRIKNFDIVLFNTSFQYLPNPLITFNNLKKKSRIFIFTNIILTKKNYHFLRNEFPDPKVYKYSYPCWFFSKKLLKNEVFKSFKIKFEQVENPPYKLNDYENYYNILLERIN